MKYCDGCGEKATGECPYCGADGCDDCIPICDHDARERKPKPAPSPPQHDGDQI